jgi:two-component system OmpR family response regulator
VRILVVEDENALAEQLVLALSQAGYAVDRASDGARADFLARTADYDAVVLDLGLPRIDGLTVLRRWRDVGLDARVMILTARGSWHEKVQGIDSGADDYLSKPFRMEELLARLRALIRRASGNVTPELTEHIYAQDFDRDSNTVEVFIARLRRKFGASFIETVRGLGYRVGSTP